MRRYRRQDDDAGVDLTPMLDIVFILLIFFIVTATFLDEFGLDVTRPDDSQDQPQNRTIPIVVQIDDQNFIFIDNTRVEEGGVRARIEQLRAENPKGPIVIQAHPTSDFGVAVSVYDQARLAGAPAAVIQPTDQ